MKRRRHRLLLQRRFAEMVFWPSLLILAISTGLVILKPAEVAEMRPYLVTAGTGSGMVLILTQFFRLRAHVECLDGALRIRLPFYRLDVPYQAISTTRLSEMGKQFSPQHERWTRRHFVMSLAPRTLVVVVMDQLPASRRSLRLWMSEYMLCPDVQGFLLAVPDWMALHTELDERRTRKSHFRVT